MSFIYVADGIDDVLAAHLNQYADAWSGVAGKGQPFNAVAVNDPINFAISARNLDPTNSRACQFLKADGTVLFQCDASGVKVSPDGTVASVPVTATSTQTLTNKTITDATNSVRPPAVSLQSSLASLGADVAIAAQTTLITFNGAAGGTYLLVAQVAFVCPTANTDCSIWLTNTEGSTSVSSRTTSGIANAYVTVPVSAVITSPAGVFRLITNTTNATTAKQLNPLNNFAATTLSAVRIG